MAKRPHITETTRKNLIDAFWKLYQTKPIERISVREITDIAGYNRGTFYLYFKDVHDVLEQIEDVYNKGFYFILGNKSENFWMNFDKRIPLDAEKVLGALQALHSEGFAIKPIVDLLPDVEFQDYITQSLYEQETLDLYSKIKPPATSYTQSGDGSGEDDKGGAPEKKEEDLSDEGQKTRDGEKNDTNK